MLEGAQQVPKIVTHLGRAVSFIDDDPSYMDELSYYEISYFSTRTYQVFLPPQACVEET